MERGTCRQDSMELKERQDCLMYDEMECEAKDCNECFMVEEEENEDTEKAYKTESEDKE